jgi:hypothetical protein
VDPAGGEQELLAGHGFFRVDLYDWPEFASHTETAYLKGMGATRSVDSVELTVQPPGGSAMRGYPNGLIGRDWRRKVPGEQDGTPYASEAIRCHGL